MNIYIPFYWFQTRKIQLGHKINIIQLHTSVLVHYTILLGIHWQHLEEGLRRHEIMARRSTNLNRNINLHLRNIYTDTYFRNNLTVLVPVEIATGQGKESMSRQVSYWAP